jgi:hypothetical protein
VRRRACLSAAGLHPSSGVVRATSGRDARRCGSSPRVPPPLRAPSFGADRRCAAPAHPGLARVLADHEAQRLVRDRDAVGRQAVRLDLLRHDVALRDPELLVLGVAGERDDVHPTLGYGEKHGTSPANRAGRPGGPRLYLVRCRSEPAAGQRAEARARTLSASRLVAASTISPSSALAPSAEARMRRARSTASRDGVKTAFTAAI